MTQTADFSKKRPGIAGNPGKYRAYVPPKKPYWPGVESDDEGDREAKKKLIEEKNAKTALGFHPNGRKAAEVQKTLASDEEEKDSVSSAIKAARPGPRKGGRRRKQPWRASGASTDLQSPSPKRRKQDSGEISFPPPTDSIATNKEKDETPPPFSETNILLQRVILQLQSFESEKMTPYANSLPSSQHAMVEKLCQQFGSSSTQLQQTQKQQEEMMSTFKKSLERCENRNETLQSTITALTQQLGKSSTENSALVKKLNNALDLRGGGQQGQDSTRTSHKEGPAQGEAQRKKINELEQRSLELEKQNHELEKSLLTSREEKEALRQTFDRIVQESMENLRQRNRQLKETKFLLRQSQSKLETAKLAKESTNRNLLPARERSHVVSTAGQKKPTEQGHRALVQGTSPATKGHGNLLQKKAKQVLPRRRLSDVMDTLAAPAETIGGTTSEGSETSSE